MGTRTAFKNSAELEQEEDQKLLVFHGKLSERTGNSRNRGFVAIGNFVEQTNI